MALTTPGLSAAIKTNIQAGEATIDAAKLQKFCDDLAGAIVTYIKANAEVTSNGATGSGTPGGPLPITALAGTIS